MCQPFLCRAEHSKDFMKRRLGSGGSEKASQKASSAPVPELQQKEMGRPVAGSPLNLRQNFRTRTSVRTEWCVGRKLRSLVRTLQKGRWFQCRGTGCG